MVFLPVFAAIGGPSQLGSPRCFRRLLNDDGHTAAVTGANGLLAPTGTVTFSVPLSPGGSLTDSEPLKNGSATSRPLPGSEPFGSFGTVAVDVSYSGDSTYGPADIKVNFTLTQGNTPPFALSATPLTIPNPGATTGNASTITVTPGGGFTGAVYLSCALTSTPPGAVDPPTCAVASSPLNIAGTATVTAAMTVNSTAPSSSATFLPSLPSRNWRLMDGQDALSAATCALVACFFLLGLMDWRRNRRLVAAFLFVFTVFGTLVACGGGSSVTPSPPPPTNPGTTPGTYMFTVNAALSANGVSQAQTTVTVTIQ